MTSSVEACVCPSACVRACVNVCDIYVRACVCIGVRVKRQREKRGKEGRKVAIFTLSDYSFLRRSLCVT